MNNLNTYTLSTLWQAALSILPNALVGEDIESPELVIYTGLAIDEDGAIFEYVWRRRYREALEYNREDN